MKKILISGFGLFLLVLLAGTKSLYVEWAELTVITAAITCISLTFSYFTNQNGFIKKVLSTAVIGFLLCWIFGAADIAIDHFLYFLPTGYEDGAPLSLIFKLKEFNDDLFIASIISMAVVLILTLSFSKLLSTVKDPHP
ncbi:MAG: hypothetical protein WB217_05035 [Mesobacillus sp.]|uniref:hypothetical protein n=1 Tax=Mesobacillus sp. TaxID=2675271 RepID=UPI003C32FBAB